MAAAGFVAVVHVAVAGDSAGEIERGAGGDAGVSRGFAVVATGLAATAPVGDEDHFAKGQVFEGPGVRAGRGVGFGRGRDGVVGRGELDGGQIGGDGRQRQEGQDRQTGQKLHVAILLWVPILPVDIVGAEDRDSSDDGIGSDHGGLDPGHGRARSTELLLGARICPQSLVYS